MLFWPGVLNSLQTGIPTQFQASPYFDEAVKRWKTPDEVRVNLSLPVDFNPAKPTEVIIFATPNGNTIEMTLGCGKTDGLDWHYDIQHIAAQTRLYRSLHPEENVALAVVQPTVKSWPAWRAANPKEGDKKIRELVDSILTTVPGTNKTVSMNGHSGGGGFMFGFIQSGPIPDYVKKFGLLDAMYNFDSRLHGGVIRTWLNGNADRNFRVLSYDDREIMLNGKKVIGPSGGTFRATHRMIGTLQSNLLPEGIQTGDLKKYSFYRGQVDAVIDLNPANKILHTVLVEENGFLWSLEDGGLTGKWGTLRKGRGYSDFIEPAPWMGKPKTVKFDAIPVRKPGAPSGTAAFQSMMKDGGKTQFEAIKAAFNAGNIPSRFRSMKTVVTQCWDDQKKLHSAEFQVSSDYLAIGNDTDSVRIAPPGTEASKIAALFGCVLPTRRLVDAIYAQSELKLKPLPMTIDRSAPETIRGFSALIDQQMKDKSLLVAGCKKDIVQPEVAGKVSIYGWHHQTGDPIQPLYSGHVDWYFDYSHGIRLVHRKVIVDGQPMDIDDLMKSPLKKLVLD